MSSHFIEDSNLSHAWGRAYQLLSAKGQKEIVPLIVSITGFDEDSYFIEDDSIRDELDKLLKQSGRQSVDTVAHTIFPYSLWNPNASRDQLYDRYRRILPRLQKVNTKNKHGIYFQRMITGGPQAHPNQLEFVLSHFLARESVRRSMLQVGIFNPALDHSNAAQRGFPCLQHITFAPGNGTLSVNAFYATQYMVERAYGNYVGLCHLGQFIANELDLQLDRVTCYTGIALNDATRTKTAPLLKILDQVIPGITDEV